MSSARTTTNHETIRKWVERHKGHPAIVRTGREGGVLRVDFDEPGGNDDDRLERISGATDVFETVEQDRAFICVDDDDRAAFHIW